MARGNGTSSNASETVGKSTRANARFVTRKLESARIKMREAMDELAEAAEAVTNGEYDGELKVAEINDLRSGTRILAQTTSLLTMEWAEAEEARIGR